MDDSKFRCTDSLLRALADTPDLIPPLQVEPGTLVGGCFRVRRLLGTGGMGSVFLALDERLGREVALKIQFRPRAGEFERICKEAQALARLNHPNVITVHEVGEFAGTSFIAMEYVPGVNLAEWLAQKKRPSREVLAVFLEAGRGLAAAHRAGLVHGDFKPGNVLVGADGRVRVADFGLAHPQVDAAARPLEGEPPAAQPGSATRTGLLAGTPAYMAPEQRRGEALDARSDQYAFSVALFEALTGSHPHRADPPRMRGKLPGWVQRVLARGMAPEPGQRFPDLEALLAELRNHPLRVRRRVLALGLGLGTAGLGLVVWLGLSPSQVCAGAERHLLRVWDVDVARAVRSSVQAVGVPYADDLLRFADARLDAFAREWTAEATQACRATHVFDEQSEQVLDLRMACLERQLSQIGALTRVLSSADRSALEKANQALGALPAPGDCGQVDLLSRVQPLPADPGLRRGIEEARAQATAAHELARMGRFEEAATGLQAIPETLLASYPPLAAEHAFARAHLEWMRADHSAAASSFQVAIMAALASGHDALLFKGLADLALMLAESGDRPANEADQWLALARAVFIRLGGNAEQEAMLTGAAANILRSQGRFPEAVAQAARCVEVREAQGEPFALAGALDVLGGAQLANGEFGAARTSLTRSLGLFAGAVGRGHPMALSVLHNLAVAHQRLGDYPAAIQATQEAIDLSVEVVGPEHLDLAELLSNLAVFLAEQGKLDQALVPMRRAQAIREKHLGPEHRDIGYTLGNLAVFSEMAGHSDEAAGYALRSMEILRKALGDKHPDVVNALAILGTIQRNQKRLEDSARHLELAVALSEQAFPPDHPDRINPLVELARTELARGKLERALRLAEEARRRVERPDVPARMRPDVWFALAEVLDRRGGQKVQALDLARRALAAWKEMGLAQEQARAEAWLRARGASAE
jgi:eukaryotic-like serine/threonine-protein kinase